MSAPERRLVPVAAEDVRVGDVIHNPSRSRPDGSYGPVEVRAIEGTPSGHGRRICFNPGDPDQQRGYGSQLVPIEERADEGEVT